ncbi:hypothetical protein H6G54_00750 [Anabaena cylindrica FACHB-243]|uniref:Uncharacterized protein n=1 Tax=Anabaena cylindrica (strain ATCC 27899 / PCC 7122) TaxID=272123 RepID=K9ZJK8_ANACC|nr:MULTISPECIES: hypothetical protein [Anabaena]AFZ59391.1 hypothetical protein Anacy_4021 [Anabaena cylindrica PCC 7122]MBD2416265.1 hypothetical protein [Anabaena cylindrica FACHB-243]MBY5280228.1 hypothetical protein [Anabaena sp. CCAP 1446/1C]MBY5308500.1 hypothetical protein [Anabaena sp. CCAP 1446/1C]MCM2405309.1 hypothetical protein [Anabaena sp. CCAP 1446/1C]
METENGKNGKAQERERRNNNFGYVKGVPGILGTPETTCTGIGTHQVGTGRENSHRTDTSILGGESIEGISGKLVGQLIDETEKQLAYYDQQSQLLRVRLQELREISEITDTE